MGSLVLRIKMVCDYKNVEVEISGSGFSSIQKHETTEIQFFSNWHPYVNNMHIVGLAQLMVVLIINNELYKYNNWII